MLDIDRLTLVRFLRNRYPLYFGKVLEVRNVVAGWLSYVPQTFPHYTRHTIEHSEEIIAQLSKLLFYDDDDKQPVLSTLSGVEAYILIVAAFLHDAGMVASDVEKVQILSSTEWKTWIDSGGGANRWHDIKTFAEGNSPEDESVRAFIADMQRRFLIAEFVRRSHHTRSARVVRQHHDALGRLAFGEKALADTIADICEAHGFRTHELDNHDKFPDRRDLRDGTVNVQLMSILLRLGDLLDMSHDRACPLLLNAACPLPADGYAHWTQYERITHRMTSSDRIEITAECMNQDEHRFLYDWCNWLVEEIRAASVLTLRAHRHGEWRPPEAEIEGEKASIAIRSHRDAKYIPSTWIFQLDRDAVFQRLIYDAYDERCAFLRELIQNAADACRCALYSSFPAGQAPDSPTKADDGLRRGFPINVHIDSKTVLNRMSNEPEQKQVITIEDFGVGMDRSVIEHFFLQIGRSYYTTEDFRRAYQFTPTSRFGVGFLSTFAVSDDIEVETFKAGSPDGALLLKLTGPRSYLLTERGTRARAGTRVTLIMRKPIEEDRCVKAIEHWCKMLEFPVVLARSSGTMTIDAEKPEDFVTEAPDLSESGSVLRVRAFDVDEDGVEGALYVTEREGSDGVTWMDFERSPDGYATRFPFAENPRVPANLRCVSGVDIARFGTTASHYGPANRIDFRRTVDVPLSRSDAPDHYLRLDIPAVRHCATVALREHLRVARAAHGAKAPRYRQHLANQIKIDEVWEDEPAMIEVVRGGTTVQLSHRQVKEFSRIGILFKPKDGVYGDDNDTPLIRHAHVASMCESSYRAVFGGRAVSVVAAEGDALIAILTPGQESKMDPFTLTIMPSNLVALAIRRQEESYPDVLLNESHELVVWLVETQRDENLDIIFRDKLATLMELIHSTASYGWRLGDLNALLKGWVSAAGVPDSRKPPIAELTADNFGYNSDGSP